MARHSNFPTLYDSALQINISKLKEWGYLDPNQWMKGKMTWSRNETKTGEIEFAVSTQKGKEYLHLNYNFRDEPRDYKIQLIRKPTNLGIGEMWFFKCPNTGKLCRKLYSIGGYFLHREAFKGCFYRSQIRGKYERFLDSTYGEYFQSEQIYREIHKKHLKKSYAGKVTKKYSKLYKRLKRADSIDYRQIERLMVLRR
ncbi:hypothetical protein [Algoriphagus aquimarinus]|uniref:Uncharacterized protein n=1 Tax=Algoriphagus aquimarinus TaxID=237018 RepID=A0A5C7AJ61_9BACT|nr:hypothetical protein [Algoriphagus aquimarinus]TXE07563.1 hypothetical protein ESV85_15320 [Algoriphagus aquimarinus]